MRVGGRVSEFATMLRTYGVFHFVMYISHVDLFETRCRVRGIALKNPFTSACLRDKEHCSLSVVRRAGVITFF